MPPSPLSQHSWNPGSTRIDHLFVIPANAGIPFRTGTLYGQEIPAFAGMTKLEKFVNADKL